MLRVRIACGLLAAACLAAAVEIVRQELARTPLAVVALVTAGVLACVMLCASLAPARVLSAWSGRAAGVRSRLRAAHVTMSRAGGGLLLGVAAVAFGLLVARSLLLENDPSDDDQAAFLETAQAVAERGGAVRLAGDLYAGRFEEANRHPLYIALLSFAPRFEAGQVLSASLAAVTLLATTAWCARRFGGATAGCFAVLLATNAAFLRFASSVVCEMLVILLSGLTWFVWTRPNAARAPESSCPGIYGRPAARWALLGVLLALLWLTKATGLILTGIAGVWLAWRIVREKKGTGLICAKHPLRAVPANESRPLFSGRWLLAAACFGLAWCVVASPLLVRNVRRFGSPFYNVNSKLLFADAYSNTVLESPRSTGELGREYWRTHSIGDIVERELRGLVWEVYILLRSLGPPPLDDGRVLVGIGLALMIVAGGVVAREEARVALVWTAVLVPVFAWYVPVAAGERFLMPLLVPLLALGARGIVATVGAVIVSPRASGWIAGGAVGWGVVWIAAAWVWG